MRSRFITDPQDPSDGFPNAANAEVYTIFWPRAGGGERNPPDKAPVEIPSAPALTSEAVASSSAQSGPTSTVSMTTGGIAINLLFDAAAMAAPASFRAGIQQAASILTAAISDKITVNIKIDYSGTGGGAAAGPDNGLYENYSSVRADLINGATPGDSTFNTLPSGSSIQGQSNVAVWNAQLKLFGLLAANNTSTDDGSATFATDINPNLLVGVALHELTHAMGRVPYGPQPDIFDLFRFTSAGTRLFSGSSTAPAAYFSVDGGNTKLADYGRTSDPSDFLNSGVQGTNDPFNEFYNGGTIQSLSVVDKAQLDALGFHTTTPAVTTVIEAIGSTSLTQVGSNFFLYTGGTGPELKYGGAAVVAGQFGAWTPIGAEQTAGGYDVAWKVSGADQYTVWSTDGNGNYLLNLIPAVSGISTALESLETIFHQDLNGDGVIGIPPPMAVEALGSTSLVEAGNNFYLNSNSSGSGPELKYGGAAVMAGQFGGWTPIGAEQTAGGYDVAWKVPGADQYTVWSSDSNGNYLSNLIPGVRGVSTALESLETIFHQDLNGDGVIGVPTVVIEAVGSTSLAEIANDFYLNSSGSSPELKYGGTAVVAGQFGGWTPIGAEQTAGGYDVAWKIPGADQYTVWSTDSSGNYLSNLIPGVSGVSTALESLETIFHQDLNDDGVIGLPSSPPSPALELAGTSSASVTFSGSPSTLSLDTPSTFSGQIIGFTGDGTLAGSDQIDLRGVNFSTVRTSYDSSAGALNVSDGTTTADLKFVGTYSQANFKFADEGRGGTIVYDLPTSGQPASHDSAGQVASNSPSNLSITGGQDSFVFAPNFGQVTLTNFNPTTDTIQINPSVFANMTALLAATHDDPQGNAVIADALHDTITIQHVTTAQLLAHQNDFHFV
jgi:serralysin